MTKYAVITGASKGIGKAAAKRLLESGYRVVNLSRTACNVETVINVSVDMMAEGWQHRLGPELLEIVKPADQLTLVHNAAFLAKDRIDDVKPQAFRDVMELNLIAPVILTQLLRPSLNEGSSVLYIASTLGRKAVANSCSYVTSKHALIGLMRTTCQDFAGTGIHTAAICPGFTDTEMLRSHIGTDPTVEADIASTVAMGRLITPEEVAELINFCAGNPLINGAVIDANLGQIER